MHSEGLVEESSGWWELTVCGCHFCVDHCKESMGSQNFFMWKYTDIEYSSALEGVFSVLKADEGEWREGTDVERVLLKLKGF